MASDQTEKATEKRRRKAASQGDRLMSREVLSASAFLAGVIALKQLSLAWIITWRQVYIGSIGLAFGANGLRPMDIVRSIRFTVMSAVLSISSVGLYACGAAIALGIIQGGGQIRVSAFSPKWSRLSPMSNLQTVIGPQSLLRLLKALLPALAIATLTVKQIYKMTAYPVLSSVRLSDMFQNLYELLLSGAFVMLLWSVVDLASTWRSREKRLRMTKQEVRDESKESEGSPQSKRRIRQAHRSFRARKLRSSVSNASVVITNPTHYAIALSFDVSTMAAPRVLAKGRDLIAAAIKDEARWAKIPIVENPLLARSLFKLVEPGQDIPLELYAVVAGILAYLYKSEVEERLKQQQRSSSEASSQSKNGYSSHSLQL